MTDSTENCTPLKSTISRNSYSSVQIQIGARRWRCFSPAAAARHQGRSQRMREKFRGFIQLWVEFIIKTGGIYRRINPDRKTPHFFLHALGPALMARGGGGALGTCPDGARRRRGFSDQFGFVSRDTEEAEFFDWKDFVGVAFCVETVVLSVATWPKVEDSLQKKEYIHDRALFAKKSIDT